MEKLDPKVVHKEEYRGLSITIEASFHDDGFGVRLSPADKWHNGFVELRGAVEKDGKIIKNITNNRDNFGMTRDELLVRFKREFNRYGFLKIKKEYYIVHISDEYDRILPLFIRRCQNQADDYLHNEVRKVGMQEITDGLPDSLKGL